MGLLDKFSKKKKGFDPVDFDSKPDLGDEGGLGLPKAKFPSDDLGGLGPRPSPLEPKKNNRDAELILAKLDAINHRLDAIERRLAEIERIAKSE